MKRFASCASSVAAGLILCVSSHAARATTFPVFFNQLTASATVGTPLAAGDTLFADTLVTTEVGPLLQTVTFTLASGVDSFTGAAAWEVSAATGDGPRLVGVNIDIFDATDTLIFSDTFAGVLAGFAHSTLEGDIGPGTYKMVATGTGVRASSLDISLTFVPEPQSALLLLSGLGLLRLAARGRGLRSAA